MFWQGIVHHPVGWGLVICGSDTETRIHSTEMRSDLGSLAGSSDSLERRQRMRPSIAVVLAVFYVVPCVAGTLDNVQVVTSMIEMPP